MTRVNSKEKFFKQVCVTLAPTILERLDKLRLRDGVSRAEVLRISTAVYLDLRDRALVTEVDLSSRSDTIKL